MNFENVIFNEDCLLTMKRMKQQGIKVDLIVTSPPYNKNKYASENNQSKSWSSLRGKQIAYDVYHDSMQQDEYEKWQKEVIKSCIDVLKPNGSLFYNHKDLSVNGLIIPPKWVYEFNVHQQIIWDRGSSLQNDPHYFQPITEYIFWIVKDPKNFFFDKQKSIFKNNIWRINAERNEHPAPFPQKMVGNIINCCCKEGGIVYDPFMGSGTTAICALKNKCHYIGSEISEKYVSMAYKRINDEENQLKIF